VRVPSEPHVPLDVPLGFGVAPLMLPLVALPVLPLVALPVLPLVALPVLPLVALPDDPLELPDAPWSSPCVLPAPGCAGTVVVDAPDESIVVPDVVPVLAPGAFCISRSAFAVQSLRSCSLDRFLHACIASALLPLSARLVPGASVAPGTGMRLEGVVRSVGCVGGVDGEPVVPWLAAPGCAVWANDADAAASAIAAAAAESWNLAFTSNLSVVEPVKGGSLSRQAPFPRFTRNAALQQRKPARNRCRLN